MVPRLFYKTTPVRLRVPFIVKKTFRLENKKSDLDVGLDIGLEDKAYLDVVEKTLLQLIEEQKPDLVLYDAGVDIWQHDGLGRLDISWQGLHDRDELVLKTCLGQHIPVATVIGGGYDKDHAQLAARHGIVIDVVWHLYHQYF